MALEDALLKLAEAINNHAQTLLTTHQSALPLVEKAKVVKEEPDAKKQITKPADTTKTDTTSASASAVETTDTPETSAPSGTAQAPDVDVAELKAKFLELVNKDRAAAEGVLTTLGFPKLNLVPVNEHAKAWSLITEALNG